MSLGRFLFLRRYYLVQSGAVGIESGAVGTGTSDWRVLRGRAVGTLGDGGGWRLEAVCPSRFVFLWLFGRIVLPQRKPTFFYPVEAIDTKAGCGYRQYSLWHLSGWVRACLPAVK